MSIAEVLQSIQVLPSIAKYPSIAKCCKVSKYQKIQAQCNAEMWQQCDMKEQNGGVEDFEQCIECAVWTCGITCNVLYTHSVCRDTV